MANNLCFKPQRDIDDITHSGFKDPFSVSTSVAPNFLQPTLPTLCRIFPYKCHVPHFQKWTLHLLHKTSFASCGSNLKPESLLWFLTILHPTLNWRQCLRCILPSVFFLLWNLFPILVSRPFLMDTKIASNWVACFCFFPLRELSVKSMSFKAEHQDLNPSSTDCWKFELGQVT